MSATFTLTITESLTSCLVPRNPRSLWSKFTWPESDLRSVASKIHVHFGVDLHDSASADLMPLKSEIHVHFGVDLHDSASADLMPLNFTFTLGLIYTYTTRLPQFASLDISNKSSEALEHVDFNNSLMST